MSSAGKKKLKTKHGKNKESYKMSTGESNNSEENDRPCSGDSGFASVASGTAQHTGEEEELSLIHI